MCPQGYVLGLGVMIVMFAMFNTNRFFYEYLLIHKKFKYPL